MNTKQLVQMANDIGHFFAADPDHEEAMWQIANHIKRFWHPQMRQAMIHYMDTHDGAGLTPLVYQSIARYHSHLRGTDPLAARL